AVQVPSEEAEALSAVAGRVDAFGGWRVARGEGQVQPQLVRRGRPICVLESGDDARWDPGQEDRDEVGPLRARCGQRREVREDARIEDGQEGLQLRVLVIFLEPSVLRGTEAVPQVLLANLDHDFVDQRLAGPGHLDPGTRLRDPAVALANERLPPARGGPNPDRRTDVRGVRRIESAPSQFRLRDLQRDRVDIDSL